MARSKNPKVVTDTNDDRVYSEELQAFLVAQGHDDKALLRLGLGPKGDDLILVEHERADQEALRADKEAGKCKEESRRADDAIRRVAELEAELARVRASLR